MKTFTLTLEITVDTQGYDEMVADCNDNPGDGIAVDTVDGKLKSLEEKYGTTQDDAAEIIAYRFGDTLGEIFNPSTVGSRIWEGCNKTVKLNEFTMVSVNHWQIEY